MLMKERSNTQIEDYYREQISNLQMTRNIRMSEEGELLKLNQRQSLLEQEDDHENWDQIKDKYQSMLDEKDQQEYENIFKGNEGDNEEDNEDDKVGQIKGYNDFTPINEEQMESRDDERSQL